MGSFVVGSSDGFESFLSSGIPDLQLDSAASGLESANFEVVADGGEEAGWGRRYLSLKMLSENLRRRLLLPTEELPMSSSLKR